jgi:O-antigen/teichoic acid export membrane protein
MRRALIFNNIASAGSIFWRIAIQLLLPPLLIGIWGTDRYGQWLLIASIPTLLSVLDFGFTDAATAEMTMQIARNNKADATKTFQTISFLALLMSVLVIIVSSILLLPDRIQIGKVVLDSDSLRSMYVFSIFAVMLILSRLLLGCLKSAGHYAASTMTYDTIQFAESTSVIFGAYFGYEFVVCALLYLAFRLLNIIVLFVMMRRTVSWLRPGVQHADFREARRLLTPSLAAMTIPAALALNFQGMVWIAGAFIGPSAAAVLGTVRAASRVIVQLVGIFVRGAMPIYAASVATNNTSAHRSIVRINSILTASVLFPGCLAFAIFGQDIVSIWTRGHVVPPVVFVSLMAAAAAFHGLWYFRSVLLLAINKHVRFAALLLPLTAAFTLLAIPAVKFLGLNGLAASILLLEATCAIGLYLSSIGRSPKLIRTPGEDIRSDNRGGKTRAALRAVAFGPLRRRDGQ